MAPAKPHWLIAGIVLVTLALAGCGASFFISSNNGRLLVAVSVNPNGIDPVNSPNGVVQFTAAGTFSMSPTTVDPITNVLWTIDRPAFSAIPDTGHAFIDANGMARCAQGFIGMAQVFATAPANPNQPVSLQNQVVGSATLMCP
jgi:hypothetical protein